MIPEEDDSSRHGNQPIADHSGQLRSNFRAKAGDRTRTGDIQLGKLTLYQLSYTRWVNNAL